jgi:LuxR family transcriptional regulator, maltose regulon positive regulatory protein
LRQVADKARRDERLENLLAALAPLALVLHQQGDRKAALETLTQTLALAEPDDHIRLFVDEGLAMQRLLAEALQQKILPAYTGRLLAAFPEQALSPNPMPTQEEALIEALSERELEVLRLIAQGLPNEAIAQRLYLSLRTVKWHSGNIYSKLGVENRTAAVARARRLGMIDS